MVPDDVVVPVLHAAHSASAVPALYLPVAQLAHAPSTSPIPAAHPQAVDPDGDTRPLGQSVHVVEPAELEYLPAGHGA